MKQLEFREIKNNDVFDPATIYPNTPFTQADFYGDWQKNLGRTVIKFLISKNKEAVAYFQLIKYPLPFGKSYFYIPYGPVTKDFSDDFFSNLKKELIRLAKNERAVFVRLDFTPPIPGDVLSKFFTKALSPTYHSAYFQPRREWFLGLEKSGNELLAGMNKKTRYAIRRAEKNGITAEIVTADFEKYFDIFHGLMLETAKRDEFSLHQKQYYKNIFQSLHKIKKSYLSIAKYGTKILAVDLIVVFGETANYVFGGSSNEQRNLCPSYLAKWKSIGHAKKLNCLDYNFGGISTEDKTYKGWDNLTTFKKRFGGREIRHSEFFDLVINPFWYKLYNLRKRLKKIGL